MNRDEKSINFYIIDTIFLTADVSGLLGIFYKQNGYKIIKSKDPNFGTM